MGLNSKLVGYNVVHTFSKAVGVSDIHQQFNFGIMAYRQLGDAMGIIIDMQAVTKISPSSLRAIQLLSKDVVMDVPMCLVGDISQNRFLSTFIKTIIHLAGTRMERVSSQGDMASAVQWIDNWFINNGFDRQELVGQLTAKLPANDDEQEGK